MVLYHAHLHCDLYILHHVKLCNWKKDIDQHENLSNVKGIQCQQSYVLCHTHGWLRFS